MCHSCIEKKVQAQCELFCPICDTTYSLSTDMVQAQSSLVLELLADQEVTCSECDQGVKVKQLDEHRKTECTKHTHITVGRIMETPLTAPLSSAEENRGRYRGGSRGSFEPPFQLHIDYKLNATKL